MRVFLTPAWPNPGRLTPMVVTWAGTVPESAGDDVPGTEKEAPRPLPWPRPREGDGEIRGGIFQKGALGSRKQRMRD